MRRSYGTVLGLFAAFGVGVFVGAYADDLWHGQKSAEASGDLPERVSTLVTDVQGRVFFVDAFPRAPGDMLTVFVGLSPTGTGRPSKRLSTKESLEEAYFSLGASNMIFPAGSGPNPDPSGVLRVDAVAALGAAFAKNPWCIAQGGAQARFNHNRSDAEQATMIEDGQYLQGERLWAFRGYCEGAG